MAAAQNNKTLTQMNNRRLCPCVAVSILKFIQRTSGEALQAVHSEKRGISLHNREPSREASLKAQTSSSVLVGRCPPLLSG